MFLYNSIKCMENDFIINRVSLKLDWVVFVKVSNFRQSCSRFNIAPGSVFNIHLSGKYFLNSKKIS